jgi:hypothetical protein
MSINAMTNAAVSRRRDFEPANEVPKNLAEIAQAAGTMPTPAPQPAAAQPVGAQPAAVQPSAVNTALQTLTTYIPTEVLTLYVAAVAALDSSASGSSTRPPNSIYDWLPFLIFLVGTPLIAWIAFATKIKSAGRPIPLNPTTWPMWEMSAAAIAFVAWAFALPKTPFLQFKWYSSGIAGLAVILVSYGLGSLGPLMQRPLSSGAPAPAGG